MANKKLLILGNPQGSGPSGETVWGDITGNLADQTDLNTALNAKANSSDLATVASSGSYNDLTNKPSMSTETLTFIDANNVETTVVVYVQPTV